MVFDAGAVKGSIRFDISEFVKAKEEVKKGTQEMAQGVNLKMDDFITSEATLKKRADDLRSLQQQVKEGTYDWKALDAEIKKTANDLKAFDPKAIKLDDMVTSEGTLRARLASLQALQGQVKQGSYDWKALDVEIKKTTGSLDQFNDVEKSTTQLLKDNSAAIMGAGVALGALGGSILVIGQKMVKLSSDAAETKNLFTVSMGDMSASAQKWVDDFSRSMGINSVEVMNYVGTLKVMLESMGHTEEGALDMSQSLAKLAYDLSSFRNISPEEAFTKIRAGIVGETEPLKALGILVDETTTKNWALTNGLIKQGEEMTQQQKVIARYNSILQQTTKDQGDLERTLDSYANVSRRAQAVTAELGAVMGTSLKDAQTSVLTLYVEIIGATTEFAKDNTSLTAGVVATVEAFGAMASVLGGIIILMPGLTMAAQALNTSLKALLLTTGGWVAGIALAIGAAALLITAMQAEQRELEKLTEDTTSQWTELGRLEARYRTAKDNADKLGTSTQELEDATSNLENAYVKLGMVIGVTSAQFGRMAETMAKQRKAQLEAEITALEEERKKLETETPKGSYQFNATLMGPVYAPSPEELQAKRRINEISDQTKKLKAELDGVAKYTTAIDEEMAKLVSRPSDVLKREIEGLKVSIQAMKDAKLEATAEYSDAINKLAALENALAKKKAEPDPARDELLKKAIGARDADLRQQLKALETLRTEAGLTDNEIKKLDESIKKIRIELGELEKEKKPKAEDIIDLKDFMLPTDELQKQIDFVRKQIALYPEGSREARLLGEALKKLEDDLNGVEEAKGKNKLEDFITPEAVLRKNLKALEDLRASAKGGSIDYKALTDEIKKTKNALGEFTPTVEDLKEKFHVTTTVEIQNTIAQLEKLRDAYAGDAVAIREVNALLEEQRKKLNELEDPLKKAGIKTSADIQRQIEELRRLQTAASGDPVATAEINKQIEANQKILDDARRETDVFFNFLKTGTESTGEAIQDTFSSVFKDAIRGDLDSFSDYFNDFCLKIADAWIDMLAKMVAEKAISGLFGGLGGSGGGSGGGGGINWLQLAGTAAGWFFGGPAGGAAGAAIGGAAGGGVPSSFTTPDAGGYTYARPAAPLTPEKANGEFEMDPELAGRNMKAAGRGQSRGERELQIINMITPEAVAAAMASKEGEAVIVNTINRNALKNGKTRKTIQEN